MFVIAFGLMMLKLKGGLFLINTKDEHCFGQSFKLVLETEQMQGFVLFQVVRQTGMRSPVLVTLFLLEEIILPRIKHHLDTE